MQVLNVKNVPALSEYLVVAMDEELLQMCRKLYVA
jgi:hypothetical protein